MRRDAYNALRQCLGLSLKYVWNPGRSETRLFRKGALKVLRMGQNNTRGNFTNVIKIFIFKVFVV